MTAQAYKTKGGSNNYLHVGIDTPVFEIGDQMKVNLNLGRSPGVRDQDFTYMVRDRPVSVCGLIEINYLASLFCYHCYMLAK